LRMRNPSRSCQSSGAPSDASKGPARHPILQHTGKVNRLATKPGTVTRGPSPWTETPGHLQEGHPTRGPTGHWKAAQGTDQSKKEPGN